MPIRRPRGPKPTLRHVAFLEAIAALPEKSAGRKALEAGFLTLRHLDEWMKVGSLVADADSQAYQATKAAIDAIRDDTETRTALHRILEAAMMLYEPDAQPVLPRVFAYGSMLEHRGQLALAADVYVTISGLVDPRAHFDLAFDALMKQGFCYRLTGDLEGAQRAYENAGMLAGRTRDRSRVLQARIGEAKVQWSRGNLPAADEALAKIAAEAETLGDVKLQALAQHDCATVARLREDLPRAVRLAYESFRRTQDEGEKEYVLSDLGNFLGLMGAYDTARAALTVLERGGRTQQTRWTAHINLMDLATREGSETRFEQARRALEEERMPDTLTAPFLRDAGKGLARFGRLAEARNALSRARSIADARRMTKLQFELDALEKDLDRLSDAAERISPVQAPDDIATAIEGLLQEAQLAHY